jgi:hypothetical protein
MRSVWIGGLVLGALLTACATDDSESEKMLVFQKFIQATDAKVQYKQMMNVITAQAHNQFSSQLREQYRILDVADPEKQNQIQGIMKEARKVFQSKFKTQMTKLIPFSEIKNSIFYPLYMNHFNTSELKSIVAFYESPAGKKLVTLTPRLMQDTMLFFNRKYGPRLNELSHSIASEEMQKIKPALQKIKDL